MPTPAPPTDESESGPECPDCGAPTDVRRNELSDDEYTHVISCTECEFEIETESNLAAEARYERD